MDKFKIELIPQIKIKRKFDPFIIYIDTLKEAIKLKDLFIRYHFYNYETSITDDYPICINIFEWMSKNNGWGIVDEDEIELCKDEIVPNGTY